MRQPARDEPPSPRAHPEAGMLSWDAGMLSWKAGKLSAWRSDGLTTAARVAMLLLLVMMLMYLCEAAAVAWTQHANVNCFPGHGAESTRPHDAQEG
eukprot:gene5247-22494_t